jgi:probable HAF family extracellular repeat protein
MRVRARSALSAKAGWVILFVAAAILAMAPLADSSPANASAFGFTQIDVPGASLTSAFGINDAGQIVGPFEAFTRTHGFLDTGGSFTQIDVPGAFFTQAIGINDAGQIVGLFQTSTGAHGFLDTGGSFTQIDVPGALTTGANGINDTGQIVGVFFSTSSRGSTVFSTSAAASPKSTCLARSLQGPMASTTRGRSSDLSRLPRASTVFSTSAAASPKSTCPARHAQKPLASATRGRSSVVLSTPRGPTVFSIPAATSPKSTCPGRSVGLFVDSTGVHGFLATPVSAVPEPSTLALLSIGLTGLRIVRRRLLAQAT